MKAKMLAHIVFQRYYVLTNKKTGEITNLSLIGFLRDAFLLLPCWIQLLLIRRFLPDNNPLKHATFVSYVLYGTEVLYALSILLWVSGLCIVIAIRSIQ